MCSIGEDDFGDEGGVHGMPSALETLKISKLSGICKKCNEEQLAVKLSFKEAECKSCFLAYVRHKFRATLGSSKILPKNADVLLIFDGGPNSATLLDMAYYAQSQSTFKRLHCNLKGLIIDDSCLGHQEPGYLKAVLGAAKRYQINWFYASLACYEMPIHISGQDDDDFRKQSLDEENKLLSVLESIKSLTSKQDFLTNLRKNIIRSAASHLKCSFVFISEICPDLATTFLANISLGRGSSTALDIGLLDDRIAGLKLVRPLKDLTVAEVQHYVQFTNIPTVKCRQYGEDCDAMASIQNLTKSFVDNLQEKFPSTVSTVFRTGSKITTKDQLTSSRGDKDAMLCRFCRSMTSCEESKTLLAIEFSRVVSEFAAVSSHDVAELEEKARKQLESDSTRQLCHACKSILKDVVNDFKSVDAALFCNSNGLIARNKPS